MAREMLSTTTSVTRRPVFIIHDGLSFPKDLQPRKGKPQKCIDTDRLRHFSMAWLLLVHEYADRPSLSVVQAP